MAKKTDSVWLGELYRFGYTLQVVGRTEEEVRDALMREYVRTYKQINDGADPKEDEWYDGESYYDEAVECIELTEMTFGKVEWT